MTIRNFSILLLILLPAAQVIVSAQNSGSPEISPDGKWIAYTVSEMDLKKDKSETRTHLDDPGGRWESDPDDR